MEHTMTIREALEAAVKVLEDVPVPVGMAETVADPIRHAVKILRSCTAAMDEAEAKGDSDGRAADPE